MTKFNRFLRCFRTKVTLLLLLAMIFALTVSNFLTYQFTLESQFNQLRDRLKVIAQTAALMVNADALARVPLSKEGKFTPAYNEVSATLQKIRYANPTIKYIYTLTKTNEDGIWKFIVDPDPVVALSGGQAPTSYPGDPYDITRCPEIVNALQEPAADKELTVDAWGVFLSGYAPIRDNEGKTIAVLGVDMAASDIYAMQKELRARTLFVSLLGILLSIVLGLLISSMITKRIRKLVEATRHIAHENLQFKVDIKGRDEIGELAESFNQMAGSLFESRKKLQEYFYNVMQSFIRILEAKDRYTRGHSERVAEYARDIALEMGFSSERAEEVRKVAVLHDIGKLAVPENILNKPGKLTEEEWKIIQEHPVIGEDALKPLMVDEELLSLVRSHHERYDGKGYPDRLQGEQITLLAQITSVADSYDAMTSTRAYRTGLSKEKAISELKNNCGTQFNPEIVSVFVKMLERENVQGKS